MPKVTYGKFTKPYFDWVRNYIGRYGTWPKVSKRVGRVMPKKSNAKAKRCGEA